MYSGDYVCMKPLRNKKISLNLGVFMFLFKQVYLPLKTSKLNLGVVFVFLFFWMDKTLSNYQNGNQDVTICAKESLSNLFTFIQLAHAVGMLTSL